MYNEFYADKKNTLRAI